MRLSLIIILILPFILFGQKEKEFLISTGYSPIFKYDTDYRNNKKFIALFESNARFLIKEKNIRQNFFETGLMFYRSEYGRYEGGYPCPPGYQRCARYVGYEASELSLKLNFMTKFNLFKTNKIYYSFGGIIPLYTVEQKSPWPPRETIGPIKYFTISGFASINVGYERQVYNNNNLSLKLYTEGRYFMFPTLYRMALNFGCALNLKGQTD